MRFDILPQARRLLAIALFSVFLVSCGTGEGPEEVVDPLFVNVVPVVPVVPPVPGVCVAVGAGAGGPGELLTNGLFDDCFNNWLNAGVAVSETNNHYQADVAVAGNPFDVNLSQVFTITPGETYTLRYRAKASVARNMLVGLGLNEAPFTNVVETIALTTEWQIFTQTITATGFGNANSRILFDMGAETGSVLIDDVSVEVQGTPGELLTNGLFDNGFNNWLNAGVVVTETNNHYQADVAVAGNPFDVNLSQVFTITPDETYTLTYRARASVARNMLAGLGLNEAPFTNVAGNIALTTEWQIFTQTITATGFGNANSRVLFDMGAETGSVFIDDVSVKVAAGGGGGGGQLLTNEGFEAGDLSGWNANTNGGTIAVDNTQASGSTWTVNITAGTLNNPSLSQSNLAVGTVTTGDQIDVSFDMCGTVADGAEVRPAVLSEFGMGIGADRQDLDNFTSLPTVWTRYNYQGIAGANVAGGVSIQFDVICGGAGTCAADVYFDNLSATIGGGMVPGAASGNSCAGGGPGPGPGPMLVNGDFEADPVDKAPWINAGTVTTNNFYTVDANDGGNVFDTNLSQELNIIDGEDYVLAFRAKASVGRDIVVGLGDAGAPFDTVLVTPNPTLTTEWQSFSFPLTAVNIDGPASRVLFDLGTVASTVDIDDVSLELVSAPGVNLLTNSDFETDPVDKAPWINAGAVTTNNFYTVDAVNGGNVFDTNLSQVLDITDGEDYVLAFRAKASVGRDIVVGLGDAGAPFDTVLVTPNPTLTTEWQSFSFPLTAVNIDGPASRVLFDLGTVASTVNIDDVTLVVDTGGGPGPGPGGELAVNGDLETGDYTGWTQFINSGVQTISTDTPFGSAFSAALSGNTAVGAGGTTEIKQANVGAGSLALGDTLRIQFDVKGTFGPGGQLNVLSFTELGAGGGTLNDNTTIAGGVDTWTHFDYNVTLAGPDADGGFSLAFNPVCGAVAGCFADVFIDNVSITGP